MNIFGATLVTFFFTASVFGETKSLPASKTAMTFPPTNEGQIAIQTGIGQYEILPYVEEKGIAFAQSCETNLQKPCKAEDLRSYFSKSQKELFERCGSTHGESRIARRHGVQKISSVCYFKEDKSFVELN